MSDWASIFSRIKGKSIANIYNVPKTAMYAIRLPKDTLPNTVLNNKRTPNVTNPVVENVVIRPANKIQKDLFL